MSKLIECSPTEDTLLFIIHTERLDAMSASDLKNELEAVWLPHIRHIHVDMVQVEFVDSSGVGALVAMAKKLSAEVGKVRLLRLKKPVRTVIELLRLDKLFEIRNH